jgi:hypothetical protein
MDPWINERFSHRTRRCNYGPLSDAWQGKALEATIDYEAPTMGRRHTRTGDPAEKSDRDVLELLVDLTPSDVRLPLGLRVTVQFWR